MKKRRYTPVFAKTFGKQTNAPQLLVHDSTDPAQIRALRAKIDPAHTLFCVLSKSGRTLETNLFLQYFYEETRREVGDEAGHHFIAVTEAGSKLEQVAQELRFRRVYYGAPGALSDFGLVPHAAIGFDTERLLRRTQLTVEEASNPGVSFGLIPRTAADQFGRDKLTLICSPSLRSLGAWWEQGCGLVPVVGEPVLTPEQYGKDRIFVYVQYAPDADPNEAAVAALEKGGQPVVRIVLKDLYDLGQVFFQWQMAEAVIGVTPFDQADAVAMLPDEEPILEHNGIKIFANKANAKALLRCGKATLGGLIRKHLDRVKAGDYFGLLVYLPMFPEIESAPMEIRGKILEAKQVATVLGYQRAASSGVFLQITCDDAEDLIVPGQEYTFGAVKAAQARGDFEALAERRLLRIHLGEDVKAGLGKLHDLVSAALAH